MDQTTRDVITTLQHLHIAVGQLLVWMDGGSCSEHPRDDISVALRDSRSILVRLVKETTDGITDTDSGGPD